MLLSQVLFGDSITQQQLGITLKMQSCPFVRVLVSCQLAALSLPEGQPTLGHSHLTIQFPKCIRNLSAPIAKSSMIHLVIGSSLTHAI